MFRFYIADYTEHDWREGTEQYEFIEHCLASVDRQKQPWLIFLAGFWAIPPMHLTLNKDIWQNQWEENAFKLYGISAGLTLHFMVMFTTMKEHARSSREELFKDAGEVVDARFASNEDGCFEGFGHIDFATEAAPQKGTFFISHYFL